MCIRDSAGFSGSVDDSGEGRWTLEAAIEEAVPADVLATAPVSYTHLTLPTSDLV